MSCELVYVFHLSRMYTSKRSVQLLHYVQVRASSASEAVDKLLKHLMKGGYGDFYFDFELIDVEDEPTGV